jgi:hypothetical protein
MPRKKPQSAQPCIGCRLRQQELDRLKKEQVYSEIVDVFLTLYTEKNDVLIYDPSNRIYQHFIKDPDVYEMITTREKTYSMKNFSSFLEQLLSETLDEDIFHLYEYWDALYKFFQKEEIFWCATSLEETFGNHQDNKHIRVKRKKIIFYFVKKNEKK